MSAEAAVAKPMTTHSPEEIERVAKWINTEEYREKNFAREALVVNPAHMCQPLGAQMVAHGFEETMPFVHGSQGCVSYFRSTFTRHFREPAAAAADAMTEDGAVFGGQANFFEGVENTIALYKPKMLAIYTTCMPEVIGDDLNAYVKNARARDLVPEGLPTPYANTPSFNGSHIHGYDAMLKSILQYLTEGKKVEGKCTGKLNLIPGFDGNTANLREYKRYCELMEIPCTMLADISETFDSVCDGTYRPYPGGTKLEDAAESINGKATISLQKYSTSTTMKFISAEFAGESLTMPMPFGIKATDAFLLKLSELFDKSVPEELKAERGRAVDAITDGHQYIHGKKFAVVGDPDYLLGIVTFLLEMGAIPKHIVCSRATKKFQKEMQALLDSSPFGEGCGIYINKDLWHLRSLLMTDPCDAIIGDTHAKWAARDAKIPLFRVGMPILDRINLHRTPVIGYNGAINLLTQIANKFLDIKDETCEDPWFEMMR
ncbi:nitrogenase molybdenum-iron protein subunit beta [Geothermobacter hydrogeniphilus]|uniref:Nitrogenase molybdenum-iron protein beta chain n=1 Tax=Geothermobacter hydrogeniphilus TaxID=1969733 RepID=A0A2K2H6K3_9BACT|nr:nitrogenase molybdenum-iron protein subunit beta [Geothermobacter hydrogeniphilus]PNU18946.1 nitrogenase molybdenum-iron protein subunit beta [Geothermobacter hydrogeniphilus]